MATQHQKDRHRKKMARERMRRYRASKPKNDGAETFHMEETPVPVILPQKPIPPRLVKLELEPVIPTMRPHDPTLFNTAGDPYRPSWFPPTVIRITANPAAVYEYGAGLAVQEAADAAAAAQVQAEAAKRALDTSVHAYWGDFA